MKEDNDGVTTARWQLVMWCTSTKQGTNDAQAHFEICTIPEDNWSWYTCRGEK